MPEIGPRLTRLIRLVISPWKAVWTVANRRGWLREPAIGTSPHLEPAALERWRAAIRAAEVYLEYGSGGSTVEAARSVKHLISVECDNRFLSAVVQNVSEQPRSNVSFHPIYVDIGWTEIWGRPTFPWPSRARVARWRRYPSEPWLLLDKLGLTPDLILVDGRFRAACVLESFLRLPPNKNCLFMLDDFAVRRKHYSGILEFATDVELFDKTLVFRRRSDFDRSECARQLTKYQMDPE